MKKRTDIDLIVHHFRRGIEMDKRLADKFKRLSYMRDLLYGVGHMTVFQVAKAAAKYFDIPLSSARLEVMEAKSLFHHLDPIERDFEKAWLLNSIKRNISNAEMSGDFGAVAREHKNLDNLLGFSKDVANNEAPVLNLNILNFNPAVLEAKPMEKVELDSKIELMLANDRKEEDDIEDIDWEAE